MADDTDHFSAGTQVVSRVEARGTNNSLVHPRGAVGVVTLRGARVPGRVEVHRDRLLAVKRGERPGTEVDAWRQEMHRDFERALADIFVPERPGYEAANRFLIQARREPTNGGSPCC